MNRLGEIGTNNKGTKMQIVRYGSQSDMDVKFLDDYGYVKEHTTYTNFKKGQVKNPYDITVCRRGFLGVGYPTWKDKKPTVDYQTW